MTPSDVPKTLPSRKLPWLLLPKLVLVAALLGGFLCVRVLIVAMPRESLAEWQQLLDAAGVLFRWLIVPGSFVLVVVSLALLWPRRHLLRERWMQVKLVLIVLTLPALHLLARGAFQRMRAEVADGSPEGPTGLLGYFSLLVEASIVVLLVALWLARFRPRLGQRDRAD